MLTTSVEEIVGLEINAMLPSTTAISHASFQEKVKWHTEFGHLNRGDMLTSEQHRCSNEKKKF